MGNAAAAPVPTPEVTTEKEEEATGLISKTSTTTTPKKIETTTDLLTRRLFGTAKPTTAEKTKPAVIPEAEFDYAQLKETMDSLDENKERKRLKATAYMLQARNVARASRTNKTNNKDAITALINNARSLSSSADKFEIQSVTLDRLFEALQDVQLNNTTLLVLAQATRILEEGLRKYSPKEVSKIMDELDERTEEAHELTEEVSQEPTGGQAPANWREYEAFLSTLDEKEGSEEEEEEDLILDTLPNVPQNTPADPASPLVEKQARKQGTGKGITNDEFENVSLFG